MNNTQTIRYEQECPDLLGYFAQTRPLLDSAGLGGGLHALVELRASQINGCDFCIRMHTREALEHGDRQERLDNLPEWRESQDYSASEQAALAWTEALTIIDHDTDFGALRAKLREHFSDRQIAVLTFDIATANLWNRVNISRH